MMPDFQLNAYDYNLPEHLIAQVPLKKRDESRLLVLSRKKKKMEITSFSCLLEYLPKKSLLVVNNSRVVPARLLGEKESHGRVEMVLLSPLKVLAEQARPAGVGLSVEASVLLRPSRRLKVGMTLLFPGFTATILSKGMFGQCVVRLVWEQGEFVELLNAHGEVPLPPYIRRKPEQEDAQRYQTVYASENEQGSVAAPTAGLHFSKRMQAEIVHAGHAWCELTLFVGYGTFSPIRCQDIRNHVMHAEYVKISTHAAEAIQSAVETEQPVIAVGTTSLRTIEGVMQKQGCLTPYQGWLDTYIYPGFTFKVVNGLITNFHLPRSSLLVLVSALAGRERILSAYRKAMEENMRFFSYGDAMFIEM
ncbi:MAG TPA: tRNA preQ1(34) S-adenosylmethionine ribosyltransferase-isomerase QueA [Desulfonatronum sp.]|nr:tRNA preQ1(34) S-adenosylmethionine ribosyltransferase-isomerase QueA [Desulfonatronum sp.]